MDGLFSDRFAGLGANRYDPRPALPGTELIAGKRAAALRRRTAERCPRLPGVYGMLDPRGRVIYVGKAKCLRARLLSYFRPGSRGQKAGRIINHTRAVFWETGPNEFAALLRELQLIRRFRPRFNVLGQPGHTRVCYICLGRRPAATAFLARKVPADAVAAYGPLAGSARAADAVRKLNDYFGLRDCPKSQRMAFADQRELFPLVEPAGCLRGEIGTCLAPCNGGVSRPTYNRHVRSAKAFLDGTDDRPLRELEAAMAAAAAAAAFERAAVLRDRWLTLKWVQDRLTWLQQTRAEFTFVYPVTSWDGSEAWYLIHRGRVLAAVDPADRRAARAVIGSVYPRRGDVPALLPAEQADTVLLVAGWFRKRPGERGRCLSPAEALAGRRLATA